MTLDQTQVIDSQKTSTRKRAGPGGGSSRPPATPPSRRSLLSIVLATLVFIAVISGLSIWTAQLVLEQSYRGHIFPGVSIRGVQVGDLPIDDARKAVEARYAEFLAQPVVLSYEGRSWTPTLAELGVTLQIDQAIDQALAAGRGTNPLAELRALPLLGGGAIEIPLRVTVDQAVMQSYLMSRTDGVERPAVDAALQLDGTSVSWRPSVVGTQVLFDEMVLELTQSVETLDPASVALRTRRLEPMIADDAARAAQAEISAFLAGPLRLQIADETFEWTVEDLARLVRVERSAGEVASFDVTLDQGLLQEKIASIADATEVSGEMPRLSWNSGDLKIARAGTPDQRIDEAQVLALVNEAMQQPADQRTLSLVRSAVPPPITADNLQTLGIDQLIGVGRSDFKGSAAYRITNIEAGMRLLDGILIPPGEEFSFNTSIGSIDESNGFVEGYAIIQNRTQLEWGGGICQDSTTVFRAAFWAGLPITERWGHSFYISWYDRYAFGEFGDGPGMDATIFTGGPDLKFLNDTGNWLLMETYVDASRSLAEVRLYGTEIGRSVELIGPETSNRTPAPTEPVYVAVEDRPIGSPRQSDTARGGMQITFTRVVKQGGVEVERREFLTRFRPWPDIFEYNPADLGPDGKPKPTPTPTDVPVEPQATPTVDDTAQQPLPSDG